MLKLFLNAMLLIVALLLFSVTFAKAEDDEQHFIEMLPKHYNDKSVLLDSCDFLNKLNFNNVQFQIISWKQIDEKQADTRPNTHIETEHKIIIDDNEISFYKGLITNGIIQVNEIGLEDLCGCLGAYAEE
jgi:hypothetical protein